MGRLGTSVAKVFPAKITDGQTRIIDHQSFGHVMFTFQEELSLTLPIFFLPLSPLMIEEFFYFQSR